MTDIKTRENRARRIAHRQGLVLEKWRGRDPAHPSYGRYMILDAARRRFVADPGNRSPIRRFSLDDAEQWLQANGKCMQTYAELWPQWPPK